MSKKATKNVWEALLQVQAGMAGIRPQARGSKGNLYIDLDLLLSKARPLCHQHGLVIVHDTELHAESGLMVVQSGVVLASEGSPDSSGGVWVNVPVGPQNPGSTREEIASGAIHWSPHAIASAFSYGRRYGLAALFAVSERDDDAAAAQEAVQAADAMPPRQRVNKAAEVSAEAPPEKQPTDRQLRGEAMCELIAHAKALSFLNDDAPDQPARSNVACVATMVAEAAGQPAGSQADLKATPTVALQAAANWWAPKAEAAGDVPL